MPYLCTEPDVSIIGEHVDDGNGNHKGQCVSLVKRQCQELQGKSTTSWRRGDLVKDIKTLPKGTPIATFEDENTYKGHAAIFISQDATGITVWDQWVTGETQKVQRRHIFFDDNRPNSSNGNKFHVIK